MSAVLALVGFILIHVAAEPMRWRLYLRQVNASTKNLTPVMLASAAASYLAPFKLGIPIRIVLLSRATKLGGASISALTAADSLLLILTWIGVAFPLWIFYFSGDLMAVLQQLAAGTEVALIVTAITGIALFGVVAIVLKPRIQRAINRMRAVDIRALRPALPAIITLVDIGSYGFRHIALIGAFVQTPHDLLPIFCAGIVATFVGMVSGIPMGLGSYELAFVALTHSMGMTATEYAAMFSANRGFSIAITLGLGIPAAARLGISLRNNTGDTTRE